LKNTVSAQFSSPAGMNTGQNNDEIVSPTYKVKALFAFTDKIGKKVVFHLAPHV
jgi:hypothetical protein